MNEANKIRVEVIEQLRRDAEAAPDYAAEAVSRAQAGRMLIPEIRALREKGYSLQTIAKLFSDGGLPMTATSLASYLKGAKRTPKAKGEKNASARSKQTRSAPPPLPQSGGPTLPRSRALESGGIQGIRPASQKE